MDKKVIAKLVFKALVEACEASKYREIKDEDGWFGVASAKIHEAGGWLSQDDFYKVRRSLLDAGFVECRNIKHQTKYSLGFFTVKPTAAGLKRLTQVEI